MTYDDARLLDHYIHRGHGPWNVSLEASYLDYELRRALVAGVPELRGAAGATRIGDAPASRRLRVCNVGIGVGLWDDWLGYVVGASITSVDRDRDICEVFELRQRRERHPHPARVVCGDVLAGALDELGERFDLITCIGSTLAESGDAPGLRQAMLGALAPGGVLFVAEVREAVRGQASDARVTGSSVAATAPPGFDAGVAVACAFLGGDGRPLPWA